MVTIAQNRVISREMKKKGESCHAFLNNMVARKTDLSTKSKISYSISLM
jgi:hypothetical protein